jgi:hypothetical protein
MRETETARFSETLILIYHATDVTSQKRVIFLLHYCLTVLTVERWRSLFHWSVETPNNFRQDNDCSWAKLLSRASDGKSYHSCSRYYRYETASNRQRQINIFCLQLKERVKDEPVTFLNAWHLNFSGEEMYLPSTTFNNGRGVRRKWGSSNP